MSGRIGKVRMKATGFEFRVIDGVPDPSTDFGASMIRNSREIAQWPDMTGYLVLGFTANGYSVGFRWDDAKSHIPRSLMPSYVGELVRRELIASPDAEDVFERNFEWVEN